MNFFEHQDRARQKTWRLIGLFALSIILITLLVNLVFHVLFFELRDIRTPSSHTHFLSLDRRADVPEQQKFRDHIGHYAIISAITLLLIGLTSTYRIMQLRGTGGDRIASELGAVWVDPDSRDPQLQRLCNVVEEMALASGVPIPHVYVLNQEKSINALAAGYSFEDAVVVVSRGALDRLTRDELQGVVAHEFTHILNGDMRLNIRMMGLLFGILALSAVGRFLLIGSPRGNASRRSGGGIVLLGFGLWCLGYIGVFFGRLIKAGVSRQREFFADASAVQFTRNPDGIAGALKKIGGFKEHSHVNMARREEVSHMFFAEAQPFWLKMMQTHPPLLNRIRAIEPGFQPENFEQYANLPKIKPELAGVSAFISQPQEWRADEKTDAKISVQNFSEALGIDAEKPDPKRLEQATMLLYTIPEALLNAAHRQDEVEILLVAILLSLDERKRDRKILLVWQRLGDTIGTRVKKLLTRTDFLSPGLSMALLDLAAPTLRNLPVDSRGRLIAFLEELLKMDEQARLLAYCFVRLLRQRVKDIEAPAQVGSAGKSHPLHLREGLIQIFSVLAMHGHESTILANQAFQRGVAQLLPKSIPVYVKPKDWLKDMDNALTILDQLNFSMKEQLIKALLITASFDSKLSLEETQLLRLICACLHVPVPPVLPAVVTSKRGNGV